MRQGLQVIQGGSVDVGVSHADLRLVGAQGEDEIRQAIKDCADTMRPMPDPELMKELSPTNGRSPKLYRCIAGMATLARNPRLKSSAWRQMRATVIGVIDSLVVPIPTCINEAYLSEMIVEGQANVAQVHAKEAYLAGDVPAMQRALPLLDRHADELQRYAALLRAKIRECGQTQGGLLA